MLARQSEYLGQASLPDGDVDIDDDNAIDDDVYDALDDDTVDDDVDDANHLKSFILILVQA